MSSHLVTLLPLTSLLCALSADEHPVLVEISTRPKTMASDIYKMVHQSIFGPGHIIQNKDSARNYLLTEMASLGSTQVGEKLYEELGNEMVRVNLRPFRDSKGSTENMLNAMIETANTNSGIPKAMTDSIAEICNALIKQDKKELADELKSLAEKQAANDYPAIRHSEIYRNTYLPAYRVIGKKHLPLI